MSSSFHTAPASSQLSESLAAIVGGDHVRLLGSGAIEVAPATEQEISLILRMANEAGLAVLPRGGATKSEWGNAAEHGEIVLSTKRMNRVLEHAWGDLTVTVEPGCTIAALQSQLAEHGQQLALDPLWPERATVGGVVATNDSGTLRLRYGSVRDLIIGITLALPDGTLARSGGKVVKNVAGYDLPKLATGALGTLGVITRAVFRLHPLPQNRRTLTIHCDGLEQAQQFILQIADSKLAHSAMQMRCNGYLSAIELDVLFEGTDTGIEAQEQHLRALLGTVRIEVISAPLWGAREALWQGDGAVVKFSTQRSRIAEFMQALQQFCSEHKCEWAAVVQATGTGTTRLSGAPNELYVVLTAWREQFEQQGGSLIIQHRPADMPPIDAWGTAGDALPLMRAIKQQFDPRRILNPGRFVGGI